MLTNLKHCRLAAANFELRRTTIMEIINSINFQAINAIAGLILIVAGSLQLKAHLKNQFRSNA